MDVKSVLRVTLLLITLDHVRVHCWSRKDDSRFFDGAVLVRRNRGFSGVILKTLRKLSEFQCAQACLSEGSCISQTFCENGHTKRSMCYLHEHGITDEEDGAVTRRDGCTFQQFVDLYEVQCMRQCKQGNKCSYDNRKGGFSCVCEPPYHGIHCEQSQASIFLFSNLGTQGNAGPKSTTGYANTPLQNTVLLFKGLQIWRVPFTAVFSVTLAGADAISNGGHGAIVTGKVRLVKETELHILVGQKGIKGPDGLDGAGGGGGTFVVFSNSTLLAAAGGGGGGGGYITSHVGEDGQSTTNGSVNGGHNGSGGLVCASEINDAGGGGGFHGNGSCSNSTSCAPRACSQGGLSFWDGGLGGTGEGVGGFGGGGAAFSAFPGGGGGYSGGGVNADSNSGGAGGGGSYWMSGSSTITREQHTEGYVLIQFFGN